MLGDEDSGEGGLDTELFGVEIGALLLIDVPLFVQSST